VRAQEQVQESEKRLSYVLDISQEGIWDWDIPTGIVTHNMQWFLILGIMPTQLKGGIESFKKYLYPEDQERVFALIDAHLRGETDTYESEHRMVDDEGNIIWVRDRGRVVERNAGGKPIRMLGSFSNISKRKKAEEELIIAKQEAEDASKAKSQFLAAMSHEIRTPMNGVIGMTSMLLTTDLTADQKDYIETIRSSGEALLTVINDILDFSKVEAGAMKLEATSFNLQQVARDTLEIFTPQVNAKGLKLKLALVEPFTSFVVGDAGRWRQILTNFVGNAVKFTTEGTVTVQLSSRLIDDQHLEIKTEVIDTGIGIAPEELSMLFKPFQQTSSGHMRKFGGTGLGLSISRQFAKLMGGDTGVSSQLGQGSNFWFTVVMPPAKDQTQQVKAKSVIEQTISPKHLLLVEDNMVNQKVAQAMIKRLGHQVDAVSNGEEAVKILQMVNYDLVLMDCQMPIMDGYQATRAIRSGSIGQVLNPNIPIVALTANVVQEDRDACFASGMDDFLSKPFDIQSLIAVFAKWLPSDDRHD
jgi:PAS domain S-box-containing protein